MPLIYRSLKAEGEGLFLFSLGMGWSGENLAGIRTCDKFKCLQDMQVEKLEDRCENGVRQRQNYERG